MAMYQNNVAIIRTPKPINWTVNYQIDCSIRVFRVWFTRVTQQSFALMHECLTPFPMPISSNNSGPSVHTDNTNHSVAMQKAMVSSVWVDKAISFDNFNLLALR